MPAHLEEAFRLYEAPADQRSQIVRYAAQHPGVARALVEAAPELEKVFGKARRRLDLVQFWDSDDDEELFGRVLLKDYPEDPVGVMEPFFDAWLPKVPADVRTRLTIVMRREDDYPPV